MVLIRHKSLNHAGAIIVVALCRPVLPGSPFTQAAFLCDRPGQIGNVFLHIRQPFRDTPQLIPNEDLFSIMEINIQTA